MIDTLVRNATVITVDRRRRVFRHGAIAIHAGQIVEVGPSDDIAARYEAADELDAAGMIAMPGLINCHIHLSQTLMRGIGDNVPTLAKLKNTVWPVQGHYDEADALISVRLGLLELIKSGTTGFLSTGLHPRYGIDAIAQAVVDSGLRGVITRHVTDSAGYGLDDSALHPGLWETGEESLQGAVEMIERWDGMANGRLRAWFSPRSAGGCSARLLKELTWLADEYGVGVAATWSALPESVEYTLAAHGLRPVDFAESVGLLGPNIVFAHGVYFDDAELRKLAASGTNIAHCPASNSKLATGVARVPEMLEAGVNVSLGSDGAPVNNTADLFREMRMSLLLHRVNEGNAYYPTAAEAIEMATVNGAKAIMAGDRAGSLEEGKRADIILIDARKPHLFPLHDPVSAVAWAANGGDVDTVLVDGEVVMRGRRVLTLDEEQILRDAEACQQKILEQARVRPDTVWPLL